MLEIYFDDRGELAVDSLPALFKAFPEYAERATASALKSEGHRLKNLLQAAVMARGVQGEWKKLNPHTGILALGKKRTLKNYRMVWKGEKGRKKRAPEYWGRKLSTKTAPLSKLRGALRYQYDADMQMVSIGFLQSAGVSQGMLSLAAMHAEGYSTAITPKMRKMLFALGFPVKKSRTVLKTPARPLIDPMFKREEDNIMDNVETKLISALQRYLYGGAKK